MTKYCDGFRIDWLNSPALERDVFAKLEAAGDIKLLPKHRSHICATFAEAEMEARLGPYDPQRTRNYYTKLATAADALIDYVSSLHEAEYEQLVGHSQWDFSHTLGAIRKGLETEIVRIEQLRQVGRRRHKFADMVLFRMASVFSEAGGQITLGGGAFTRFLSVIWTLLPDDTRSASEQAFIERARGLLPQMKAYAQASQDVGKNNTMEVVRFSH